VTSDEIAGDTPAAAPKWSMPPINYLIAITSDLNPNVAHSPSKRPVAKKARRPIADMQSVGPLIGLGRSIKRG
jgi:hypothetical protein